MYITKPYTKEDFLWTQWGPEDMQHECDAALLQLRKNIEKVVAVLPAEKTFENTMFAIEEAVASFALTVSRIDFLLNVSPKAEVRELAQKLVDVMQAESLEIVSYNEALYKAVKEYAAKGEELTGPSKKLLADTLRDYKRSGFELSLEDRNKVKENYKRLQVLCTEFQKNINDYEAHIVLKPSETVGLSDAYLKGLKQDEQGNYLVTVANPDYIPFIENAKSPEKRKELVDLFFKKGGDRNIELLSHILEIRQENSALLGYKTHADFVTETRMAKSAEQVGRFLTDLTSALKVGVTKDLEALTNAKRADLNQPEAQLEYYDPNYYITQLTKQNYNLDKEQVREYFPLEHVISQMFSIYSTLFSIQFTRMHDFPTWHEDVEAYEVRNIDGALVAYFMLDLYPRENKYGHAAEFPVVIGHKQVYSSNDQNYVAPLACMVTNFPKPREGAPSLMSHDEIETLFHEFGHVMHENLARAQFYSQSGTIVARDFVEAPSQMLENWVWDRDILKKISKHYKTGEALPAEIIDKMLASKSYMEGYFNTRQMVLSLFDFRLHTENHNARIVELYNDIVADLLKVGLLPEHRWPAGFGHLAGGYDAGYYGYMWSKVYSCDMFTRFKQAGLLDATVGMEYRKKILEVGSSRDEMESVKDFLGRDPNNKAFLEELGLS